jgi:hypothetical protein
MKQIQTSKVDAFMNWRKNNINKYGNIIWLQLNYDPNTANIMSIILEQIKPDINVNTTSIELILKKYNIPFYKLDFYSNNLNICNLHILIGLRLAKKLKSNDIVKSYWDYRLKTIPQNCLTADVDSLEIKNDSIVLVEAAQLFETCNIDEAIKHIFRTFKYRKNQVNEKQYYSHYKLAKVINGCSYILFHKIKNNQLIDNDCCLLIKNNEDFYNLLCNIKKSRNEQEFLKENKSYLINNLIKFSNIYDVYDYMLSNQC